MGSWFGGVPSVVRVCGVDLMGAEEALAHQDPRDPARRVWGLRARMTTGGHRRVQGCPASARQDERASSRGSPADRSQGCPSEMLQGDSVAALKRCFRSQNSSEALFDIEALADGLELGTPCQGDIGVRHRPRVDGSISMTAGPAIPSLPTLGLQGSEGGELNDEPDAVLRLAASLTGIAAVSTGPCWRATSVDLTRCPRVATAGHHRAIEF